MVAMDGRSSTAQEPQRVGVFPLTPADQDAALALLLLSPGPYTEAGLRSQLRALSLCPWVQLGASRRREELVGVILGRVDEQNPRVGWCLRLVVHPDMRGLGVGGHLVHAQLHAFRQLGCHSVCAAVPASEVREQSFMSHHGFVRRTSLDEGVLLMERRL
ncbi:MAG: GNAT family N-acetyltransferase [Myxococcota bacterium]